MDYRSGGWVLSAIEPITMRGTSATQSPLWPRSLEMAYLTALIGRRSPEVGLYIEALRLSVNHHDTLVITAFLQRY